MKRAVQKRFEHSGGHYTKEHVHMNPDETLYIQCERGVSWLGDLCNAGITRYHCDTAEEC